MTNQTQAADKPAVVLAALTPATASKAASQIVGGIAKFEKAKNALLLTLHEAAATIGVKLTAAQYDKQFREALSDAFNAAVKRKGSSISEETAKTYKSLLKTALLAMLNGLAEPLAGESFFSFCKRVTPLVADAKTDDGQPLWAASVTRSGGRKPNKAKAATTTKAGTDQSDESKDTVSLAAAKVLAGGNVNRALALQAVMASHVVEFDKWVQTILSDKDRATLAKLASVEAAKAQAAATPNATPVTAPKKAA